MSLKDYEILESKGSGAFGIVHKCRSKKDGTIYALKRIKKEHFDNEDYLHRFEKEIKYLKELSSCENTIDILDCGNDPKKKELWFIMPLADSNLERYISENNNLKIEIRISIIDQIIAAMKYAHSKNIIHRDLAPTNILIFNKDDIKPTIKVTDFGLGKDLKFLSKGTTSSVNSYGHYDYTAPEQYAKLKNGNKLSDIYALGKVIYFIYTGKQPRSLESCDFSVLINKAITDKPEERFQTIDDLEEQWNKTKNIVLNTGSSTVYQTAKDYLKTTEKKDLAILHKILIEGKVYHHIFYDYLYPVCEYFKIENNLKEYYSYVNLEIKEFVVTFSRHLDNIGTGWDFSYTGTFGKIIKEILLLVEDDEIKIMCFKKLWYLGYVQDQYSVQRTLNVILNKYTFSSSIETQLAEYIQDNEVDFNFEAYDISSFPDKIKNAIHKASESARKKRSIT